MKKTSKIIISFAVAIAVVATILIVAVFKKDDGKAAQPSVLYTLQPTVNTVPMDTNAWVDPNAVWSDLVSDTDAALTATTIFNGGVTVPGTGTSNITQFIYVDQNGNVIDPNNIGTVVVTQNVNPNGGGEVMDDATMPQENTQANDDVTFSEYEINSQGIITKYNGTSALIVIPAKVNGITVTGLGDSCFANSGVKNVHIPSCVTSIGNGAFQGCTYLNNVSFDDSTVPITIGDLAFQDCISLSNVYLPVVKKIGNSAFGRCTSLKTVVFKEGSEAIGDYCFTDCKALTTVKIPDSVTNIGARVFNNCNMGTLTVCTPVGSSAETYAENAGAMIGKY